MHYLCLGDRGFPLWEFVLTGLLAERLPAGPDGSSCEGDKLIHCTLIAEQLLAK